MNVQPFVYMAADVQEHEDCVVVLLISHVAQFWAAE